MFRLSDCQPQGIPEFKKVKIAVVGQGWTTIVGPPSILNRILEQCTALKSLPQHDLNIRGPFHTLCLSDVELGELLGTSALLDLHAGNGPWRLIVKAACEHVLTRPFDVIAAVKDLDSRLDLVKKVDLNVIGTSSHVKSIENQLKATGRQITVRHEDSWFPSPASSLSDEVGKIAIVGMAGQSPGANSLSDFWRINLVGQDMHKRIPEDRFDVEEFFSATHEEICSTSAQYGCFIDRPGAFDAHFFNVSHREALLMEPCHRLWLMSVYEALEMAGYSQDRTRTTDPNRIGVFFGQSVSDWRATTHHRGCNSYNLQGTQRAFGPGRVNYHFKWEGPSYNIDSACASSASAITLACQNLLSHEIDMAVAGGANVISSPHAFSELSRAGVLSLTGNCKTFRDDADGYCRGEFSGAIVLKRIEDAVAANDNVLAVIAASARNHSGNASSITNSDVGAQHRLFNQVLSKAHVAPEEISYIEMHGTGTPVGDLAEMRAVVKTFKRGSDKDTLRLGALKANMGHSEGAAGVASLMKCVLSLQKETLPPVANMPHKLNPDYPDLQGSNIEIQSHSVDFKASKDNKRRMIVNNFDASGGNTCILVEDFAHIRPRSADPRSCHVVTSSAKSAKSHVEGMKRLLSFLQASGDGLNIEDLAYTTTARKIHYPFRTAITATSTRQLIATLDADIKRNAGAARVTAPPIIFMFTGQGSHYAGMGATLYKSSSVFRNMIDLCETVCNQHGFSDFVEIISNPSIDLYTKTTTQTQLAVFCLEIALASFWQAQGIEPDLVMGHSLGEYAAFYVAGVLSLVDALLLVGRRAEFVLERCEQQTHSMLSVVCDPDTVIDYIKRQPSCQIACLNSPKATVVSGAAGDIETLQKELAKDGVRSAKLSVPYAFHSEQVDDVLVDYATLAHGVTFFPPKRPIASTVYGSIIERAHVINEEYLVRQTRGKVDFVGGLKAAAEKLQNPIFLEIGPKRVLGDFVQGTLKSATRDKIASTLEGVNEDWSCISKTLASLYRAGVDIDWTAFHQPYANHVRLISIPTYSWELKDYWLKWTESREAPANGAPIKTTKPEAAAPISPLLHYVETQILTPNLLFTFRSSVASPYLKALIKGHRFRNVPVCPGGVYCEIGVEAARYALEIKGIKHTNLVVLNALFSRPFTMLQDESSADIITTITMQNDKKCLAAFAVRDISNSYNIGQCQFGVVDVSDLQSQWDRTSYFIKARADGTIKAAIHGEGHRFKSSVFYSLFSRCLEYDGPYKAIKEAYVSPDFSEAAAEVILEQDPSCLGSCKPYWNDSLVHLAGFLANANPLLPQGSSLITNGFADIKQTDVLHPAGKYLSYVRAVKSGNDGFSYDIFVFDSTNKLVMQCSHLEFRKVDNASLDRVLGKTIAAPVTAPTIKKFTERESPISKGVSVLDALLNSIATETGTDMAELTDDGVLSELGVDSIMAMQIVATVKKTTGFDVPTEFVFQCHTIGEIRKELAATQSSGSEAPETKIQDNVVQAASAAPLTGLPPSSTSSGVFNCLIRSISAETETGMNDLADDVLLSEVGCDSIMAIHIANVVKKETGYDLQGSFIFEYPSIADLRRAFGGADKASSTPGSAGDESSWEGSLTIPTPPEESPVTSWTHQRPEIILLQDGPINRFKDKDEDQGLLDFADVPSAKVVLMQGKPSSKEAPLFLMSDGFGTAATYIHLPRFKSGLPVYAIESPFLRCPGKLTRKAGIPAIAKFAVEAMLKTRPEGPYLLGGFSGGATISYEICRQLAARGKKLQGLLLIDMICPREMNENNDVMAKGGLPLVQRLSPSVVRLTKPSQNETEFGPLHLKQVVRAICHYNPPPMVPQDRPEHVCIIWAQKGLVERARSDSRALSLMSEMNLRTEMPEGFMTDPSLGPAAWSVPNKTGADLGPNGWDQFLGDNIKVLVADADHMSMPVPPDVGVPSSSWLKSYNANSALGHQITRLYTRGTHSF